MSFLTLKAACEVASETAKDESGFSAIWGTVIVVQAMDGSGYDVLLSSPSCCEPITAAIGGWKRPARIVATYPVEASTTHA